jgi:magnesium transporter
MAEERTPSSRPESATEPGIEEVTTETSPEDERVAELIAHTIDVPVLAEAVEQQAAADAADTLEQIEEEEAADVLEAMHEDTAAEALAEMQGPLAAGVIEDLIDESKAPYAGRLIEVMAPDDAADLLQELPDAYREDIYHSLPADVASRLRRLAGYREDSAGGLMTTDFVALHADETITDAVEKIRARTIPEDMHHLPVIDVDDVLVGVLGLRALLLNPPTALVGDIVDGSPKAIRSDLDREDVAREFDRYDLFMLPVIDDRQRLLGIVTVDDVIDIIREEQTEDVQKTVGAGGEEAVYSRLTEKFRGRFPWLVTSLFMTCAAAIVVLLFEDLIREQPILAFLMPVIAALVGNAGHQALAVTLRGIVLDEVRRERVRPLVVREALVGLLNGLGLALLMVLLVGGLSAFVPSASWRLGIVAGVALAASMTMGTLAGAGIPLIMRRYGADPAQSSAIFLIMITDAVAFATFLGLAFLAERVL